MLDRPETPQPLDVLRPVAERYDLILEISAEYGDARYIDQSKFRDEQELFYWSEQEMADEPGLLYDLVITCLRLGGTIRAWPA